MICIVVVLLDELAGTPSTTVARERAETRMEKSCMAREVGSESEVAIEGRELRCGVVSEV